MSKQVVSRKKNCLEGEIRPEALTEVSMERQKKRKGGEGEGKGEKEQEGGRDTEAVTEQKAGGTEREK